jgi:hypothetical protein
VKPEAHHPGSTAFVVAGASSAAIALLHVGCIVVGAPAYRYFGAGESMAKLTEAGSMTPALITAGIAALFAVSAWYALAGAGRAARPPFLYPVLTGIALIFLLRGASAPLQALALIFRPGRIPVRYFVFSLVALAVGLLYAAGVWQAWRARRAPGPTGN